MGGIGHAIGKVVSAVTKPIASIFGASEATNNLCCTRACSNSSCPQQLQQVLVLLKFQRKQTLQLKNVEVNVL